MTLRLRCQQMCDTMQRNALLRQGSPVDDLMAFVVSEVGRKADKALEESLPLCLYFGNAADRDEFIELIRDAKPTWVTRRVP